MARFNKLVYPESVSNETIDQRDIDEKTYPVQPQNKLIDNLLPLASLDVTGKLPAMLKTLKNSKADIYDKASAERIDSYEDYMNPEHPAFQMALDQAMSANPMMMIGKGTTRAVKEGIKKFTNSASPEASELIQKYGPNAIEEFGKDAGTIWGKLKNLKAKNIIGTAHKDLDLAEKIRDVGLQQRYGGPEDLGQDIIRNYGGQIDKPMAYEMLGDLPNRVSRPSSSLTAKDLFGERRPLDSMAAGDALTKIEAYMPRSGYPQRNPPSKAKELIKQYGDSHRSLPAYNEIQALAKNIPSEFSKNTTESWDNMRLLGNELNNILQNRNTGRLHPEPNLNAINRLEKTLSSQDIIDNLINPKHNKELLENPYLKEQLKLNEFKQYTPYINKQDEIIGDLNKIKAVIKQNPVEFDPTGNFKNVYSTNGKIIKKFRKDEYVPEDLLPSAIQEQINFNKMGDLNPNTKTYKTTKNIWQTQDKYTPMKNLAEDQYDIDNGRAIVEYLLKKKGLGPTDMHDTNFGGKLGGTYKVFDTGTFDNITNIDNSDIELLNKTFKTLPDDRADYLNELLKLKLEKK